jgi:D-alanyl-D-alanine carboxypeptidase/D-alanyl-D-alanine-endopeptidase (penicillin-binding protein 4)
MGLKRSGTGSTDAGIAVINADTASLGLPLDGVARVDGSGLATENKLTCSFVQGILDSATPSGELTKGLAVGGQTGTLEDRFKGAVAGRLRAKTGTLNQVTALAGYLPTAKGSAISFAYILNLSRPERITQGDIDLQEELAAILDTYPETPDAALLGPKPLP